MKQTRLDALSDGIFAIVITLLAFDLKFPTTVVINTNQQLWNAILSLGPVFASLILSFSLLFTYWRSHHYIVSVFAKSIDFRLTTINALFFFFITLVPFSSRLLGEYGGYQLAVVLYSINIICIGLSLLWMRQYILYSPDIDREHISKREKEGSFIRTIVPVLCALAAVWASFYTIAGSFAFLGFAIIFNLLAGTSKFFSWLIGDYHRATNTTTE